MEDLQEQNNVMNVLQENTLTSTINARNVMQNAKNAQDQPSKSVKFVKTTRKPQNQVVKIVVMGILIPIPPQAQTVLSFQFQCLALTYRNFFDFLGNYRRQNLIFRRRKCCVLAEFMNVRLWK